MNDSKELISTVITLKNPHPVSMPYDQGRALNAVFLDWVQTKDPNLSHKLHSPNHLPRPFTVSNLNGLPKPKDGIVFLPQGSEFWFRITSISKSLSDFLSEEILANPPERMSIAGAEFQIQNITCNPNDHIWAGGTTYNDLVNHYMLGRAYPKIQHYFASATSFHSHGNHLPFVLPSLAIGSWMKDWNAYAPLTFPKDLLEKADKSIAVSYYKMHSVAIRYGKMTLVGGVGKCTFNVVNDDPYWRHLANVLSAFAFYSGTGVKTALGLGQTRRLSSGFYRGLR